MYEQSMAGVGGVGGRSGIWPGKSKARGGKKKKKTSINKGQRVQFQKISNPDKENSLKTGEEQEALTRTYLCVCVCECQRVFRGGAGVCGLSVYLSGGDTPSSTAFSGLTLLFSPSHATAACGVRPGQGLSLAPSHSSCNNQQEEEGGWSSSNNKACN